MVGNDAGHLNGLRVFELTGISGECLGTCFSGDGNSVVVCGNDPNILFFNDYRNNDRGIVVSGHKKAVLEVCWNKEHGSQFLTCSADKTVRLWDSETFDGISKFKGHSKIVNSCKCTNTIAVSGSDDGNVCIWDLRLQPSKACIYKYENKYPITAVSMDGEFNRIFAGGIDNNIYWIDMRRVSNIVTKLASLGDTITGLDVCPFNSSLASNSMDNQIIIWDIKPHFDTEDRKLNTLLGATHSFEQNLHRVRWSHNGELVAAASSDKIVYIWSVRHKKLINKLPGHEGATTDVCFHPSLPILASSGVDKRVLVGEFI
ncbi:WD repeat [Cryptosporidium xiaoi]|uniref:WD repeat n=1 Tax=Cryptosporidium xiaoi TaxID=659607 RepID=A0AAV9XZ89_9CRYT|nr:WD repeat [Cryptosporidium bovis]